METSMHTHAHAHTCLLTERSVTYNGLGRVKGTDYGVNHPSCKWQVSEHKVLNNVHTNTPTHTLTCTSICTPFTNNTNTHTLTHTNSHLLFKKIALHVYNGSRDLIL